MILRRIARPMLAAVFVSGGIETLRNPASRVEAADPLVSKAADQVIDKVPEQVLDKVPDKVVDKVPTDTESLVKINAAAQIGAGIALALGKFPRFSALVLAGSVLPTTLAGHRFWEKEDPKERAQQQVHFFKNVGLLGGLLLAAADTHGKPSAAWRAKHAARSAADSVRDTAGSVLP
ncbi:DoxX family membrane protein [Actinophytocola algeriensis]|uniref:Putative membrane protein YphA (DoxX/SURF4 family) n=1 Tax=Actinophytocola algeriensis TaxID=1768010 RepID=A0A7W7VE90_9PSEU|nr:DoxX family protein [Actinophytocola algeriensis]MBB4906972.1 putative membrane protein YphA (DoxX/SURF4 family) [Actinophytocola algeriensis]MBE1478455.1 putative membrane protein YphA (DoxX/SURF4 family) [Actinophytocola algeriensis]